MLIRKLVAEVFEAFVDPAITTRFWFTKGSGRLEKGKQIDERTVYPVPLVDYEIVLDNDKLFPGYPYISFLKNQEKK